MKPHNKYNSFARIFPAKQNSLQITPSITLRVVMLLLAGVVVLALFHVLIIVTFLNPEQWIYRFFFLGYDNNIPAWYSSMLLSLAAFLAYQCSELARKFGRRDHWSLIFFCALLLLMSCDEIARFHEVLPVLLGKFLGLKTGDMFKGHNWIPLGVPIVIIILSSFFVILTRVLKRHRPSLILLGLGLAAIVLGGVVLESLAVLIPHGTLKKIEILAEESLEMMGTLLICASLITWRDHVLLDHAVKTDSKR